MQALWISEHGCPSPKRPINAACIHPDTMLQDAISLTNAFSHRHLWTGASQHPHGYRREYGWCISKPSVTKGTTKDGELVLLIRQEQQATYKYEVVYDVASK